MKENNLYPLMFSPILKEKVWGGQKLQKRLGKESQNPTLGESWEISAVDGDVSVVTNGALKNTPLTTLIRDYKELLVGKKVFDKNGTDFPLLFKYIDAYRNLSLQVHPDNQLAKKRHNCLGKTEMWYVLQADKNAGIYVGFKEGTTQQKYLDYLNTGQLEDLMNFECVKSGDVFFIKPGLVHAIGKGVLLAEIQQSSDITYRVFDWNRKDLDGNYRQLHTREAVEAIDFKTRDYDVAYQDKTNTWINLVENEYFKTRKLNLNSDLTADYSTIDSFVVYMCVKGKVQIECLGKFYSLHAGQSILIPAVIDQVILKSDRVSLLEITN